MEGLQYPRTHEIRRLVGPHDPEIVVDSNAEDLGEWVEQRRVLGGRDVDRFDGTILLEGSDNRGELDDLGSGSEQCQDCEQLRLSKFWRGHRRGVRSFTAGVLALHLRAAKRQIWFVMRHFTVQLLTNLPVGCHILQSHNVTNFLIKLSEF